MVVGVGAYMRWHLSLLLFALMLFFSLTRLIRSLPRHVGPSFFLPFMHGNVHGFVLAYILDTDTSRSVSQPLSSAFVLHGDEISHHGVPP